MASRTSEYYKKNPKARAKRLEQQKKYQKQRHRVKARVELNRINRKVGKKGDGKDVSHCKNGKTVLESASKNRARNRGKLKCKPKKKR
tara:strand:- start:291 stop:554 length:264 start_codon:yes stop_codon:yes gene_type:complete